MRNSIVLCFLLVLVGAVFALAADDEERTGAITVSGTVVNEDGTPFAGETIQLLPVAENGGVIVKYKDPSSEGSQIREIFVWPQGKTDEEGRFSFEMERMLFGEEIRIEFATSVNVELLGPADTVRLCNPDCVKVHLKLDEETDSVDLDEDIGPLVFCDPRS